MIDFSKYFVLVYFVAILVDSSPQIGLNINNDSDAVFLDPESKCYVTLNFSNMYLDTLHKNFIVSPYVTSLSMQNSMIRNIEPGAFGGMPNLAVLDLSNNYIQSNLFSFGGHANLETLILNNNKPRDRYDYNNYQGLESNNQNGFPKLKRLHLRNTAVRVSTSVFAKNLPSLIDLDISENIVGQTELTMKQDRSLIIFDVLPHTVSSVRLENMNINLISNPKPSNLISLILNGNDFSWVSARRCYEHTLCLINFEKLQHLSISNCQINEVESDAFKDVTELMRLNLSMNNLQSIPGETFDYLPNLTELDLSQNQFKTLPDICALINLESLYLNYMKLLSVKEMTTCHLPRLKKLSLRSNSIQEIQETFLSEVPTLEELDLSQNKLKKLHSWITQSTLRRLYLQQNEFMSLDDISLTDATSLELLDITNNSIKTFDVRFVKTLPDTLSILI